jgi:hypothetical protein
LIVVVVLRRISPRICFRGELESGHCFCCKSDGDLLQVRRVIVGEVLKQSTSIALFAGVQLDTIML